MRQPGDYLTARAGGTALVVVRGHEGELRAFHNMCRHRGAELVQGTGNVANGIRCFYHSWLYATSGELKRVPQTDQFPDMCKDDLGLRPASIAVWRDLVFVHPDPDAEPFDEWLNGLDEHVGPYRLERLDLLARQRHTVAANWKLFIENHIDGYHLWHLHSRTIKGLDHARQRATYPGRHWTFREPSKTPGVNLDERGTGLPPIDHIDESWFGSSVHLLFPSLAMAGGATFFVALDVVPEAPDRTLLDLRLFTMPVSKLAIGAKFVVAKAGATLGSWWATASGSPPRMTPSGPNDIVLEDIAACESIQRSMASSAFEVGPLAQDYERSITEFHRNVLAYVRRVGE